jgi:hypothetical protein
MTQLRRLGEQIFPIRIKEHLHQTFAVSQVNENQSA